MEKLRALLTLAVIVGAFYFAWVLIPPYYNNYTFQDAVETEARMASYQAQRTDQDVAETLAKKAKELDIPLTAEQIHISRNGSDLTVTADYTVTVNTIFKPIELKFSTNKTNRRI